MFRCPNCKARKEFKIRNTGYSYKVLESLSEDDNPVFQSKEFECKKGNENLMQDYEKYKYYRMTCMACGHKDKVEEFKNAFDDPMKYFDTQNLCDCGGEVWQDIQMKKVEEQQGAEFDGDQRRVNQQIVSVVCCESCKKTSKMKRIQ